MQIQTQDGSSKRLLDGLSVTTSSDDPNSSALAALFGEQKARQYYDALVLRSSLLGSQSDTQLKNLAELNYLLTTIPSGNESRTLSRKKAATLLSGVLDECDRLSLLRLDTTLKFSRDYHNNNRHQRARRMLRDYIKLNPDEPDAHAQLIEITRSIGDLKRAKDLAKNALERIPDARRIHYQYGLTLLETLQYDRALRHLEKAGTAESPFSDSLTRARQLRAWYTGAKPAEAMPTIEVAQSEHRQGQLEAATLALAVYLYRTYGTLLIANAFDSRIINDCYQEFLSDRESQLNSEKPDGALQIGDRRYQLTVSLKGAFNQPGIYANPFILQLMKKLVNPKVILGSAVCATSLPGSRDQHLHKDHRALFTGGVDDEPIDIPSVAITTMVPLVALDNQIGTTQVVKGSHRRTRSDSARLPTQTPTMPVGSCFLMDMALSHKGLGNRTRIIRPILNMVYQQHWFVDNKNFQKQLPVHISAEELAKIPAEFQSLFEWSHQPAVDITSQ